MTKLENILQGISPIETVGCLEVPVETICFDSRKVQKGSLYVAQRGTQVDGHNFIENSVEKGAKVIVCETLPDILVDFVTYIQVEESSVALAILARNFYGNPSADLKLVGVTGTNGKTSIATLLYELFTKLGYKSGLLSTIANYVGNREYKATHTTPDVVALNELLREMVDAGCTYCFMEVSSHSLVQNRVYGLRFVGGIFTNLTHDHLDYHKTFISYLKAKKSFFDTMPKESFVLVNTDDKNGQIMTQNTQARVCTYGVKSMAQYRARVVERHFDNTLVELNGTEVWTNFIGDFNTYNLLAVYGVALELGVAEEELLVALSLLKPVAGRLDTFVSERGVIAVIDYAHTPDALKNVLETLHSLEKEQQLIVVFGAGGNRDKTKRPEMGKIASSIADKIIITSDNPRNESPETIINEIYAGVDTLKQKDTLCIVDRREAIKTATMLAQKGDVILVAGKGHEDYQEVAGVRLHFDDKEEIKKILS